MIIANSLDRKKKFPFSGQERGEQKQKTAMVETYLNLPVEVNSESCWWCSFFHHPTVQRPAKTRQRIRFVCSFTGETAKPSAPVCEFFTVQGVEHEAR